MATSIQALYEDLNAQKNHFLNSSYKTTEGVKISVDILTSLLSVIELALKLFKISL
jgi:hypothetical protein